MRSVRRLRRHDQLDLVVHLQQLALLVVDVLLVERGLGQHPEAEVPDETGGPYPGDGSNGPNVLDDSGIVRSDITSSFGSSTTKAQGVPLTINLTVTDAGNGYSALAGAAVYLWHCDRDGQYSLYSQGVTEENYLRGVQATNAAGTATFTSIFPAAYSGRWPHIHFEVYQSLAQATSSGQIVKTSQIALPEAACAEVYATVGLRGERRATWPRPP